MHFQQCVKYLGVVEVNTDLLFRGHWNVELLKLKHFPIMRLPHL